MNVEITNKETQRLEVVFQIKNKAEGRQRVIENILRYTPNGAIIKYGHKQYNDSDIYKW